MKLVKMVDKIIEQIKMPVILSKHILLSALKEEGLSPLHRQT